MAAGNIAVSGSYKGLGSGERMFLLTGMRGVCYCMGERWFFSLAPSQSFGKSQTRTQGDFGSSDREGQKAPRKMRKERDRKAPRKAHILARANRAKLLFCGGGSPFTVAEAIAQNNGVLCNLVRQGCAGLSEG